MPTIAPYQTERLTVQRDRVHGVRLLDRREVSARLRDAGVCGPRGTDPAAYRVKRADGTSASAEGAKKNAPYGR